MRDGTFNISVCQQAKEGNGGQPRTAAHVSGGVWVWGKKWHDWSRSYLTFRSPPITFAFLMSQFVIQSTPETSTLQKPREI